MLALMDHAEPFVADETEATIAKKAAAQFETVARAGQDVQVVVVTGKPNITVPLPARALELIFRLLQAMGDRTPISIIPHEAELTTQQAADFLNVSRPYLTGLVDRNEIPHRMVGRHRRIRFADLLDFEKRSQVDREKALAAMAEAARKYEMD